MDRIHTSHILLFKDNSVLLVRHEESAGHLTGTYGIPGGHLDDEESLTQGAIRECKEETGLLVDEKDLAVFPENEYTADIQKKDGTTKRYTMHIYFTKTFRGSLKSDHETTPEWVSLDALDSLNLLPNVKNAILAAQAYLQKGHIHE